MQSESYIVRRAQLATYFDHTASDVWARLTSDAPVSRIRQTVREGRDAMRATILGFLPQDLRGCRVLDAGCGTGALAVEAARRGAEVVAVDLSPTLIGIARERMSSTFGSGHITFVAGDMLDRDLGAFDHIVAMDSLIHYKSDDMADAVAGLATRARRSLVFTFAPRTPALALKHSIGKLFPRSDRSPAIEPVVPERLREKLVGRARGVGPSAWRLGRTHRIASAFYISQALEVVTT